MKEQQSVMKRRWFQVLTGILSLNALGISLMMIRTLMQSLGDDETVELETVHINYAALRPVIIALLLSLTVLHVILCVAALRESVLLFLKHLVYVLSTAGAAALLFLRTDTARTIPFACFFYVLAVLIGSLIELIRKRSKWNVLLFILMLVVAFFGVTSVMIPVLGETKDLTAAVVLSIIIIFFLIDVQGVASIVPLAFSSIRLDILKKIIKKTYATEILFGIVLLIVAFSFILPAFEPGIDNFWDALWYCFAIVTTIGFGDIYATSGIGRILSVILGLYGIIVVSLITSIIVNFYGEMKKEEPDNGDGPDENLPGERIPDEDRHDKKPHSRKKRDETPRGRRKRDETLRGRRKRDETPYGRREHDETPRGERTRPYEVITEEIEL